MNFTTLDCDFLHCPCSNVVFGNHSFGKPFQVIQLGHFCHCCWNGQKYQFHTSGSHPNDSNNNRKSWVVIVVEIELITDMMKFGFVLELEYYPRNIKYNWHVDTCTLSVIICPSSNQPK